MKLISWNVNGLRAALRQGLADSLRPEAADVICLQETRCHPTDVDANWAEGYSTVWHPAEKKGYSGTVVLSREKPLRTSIGLGQPEPDREGRVLTVEFPDHFVVNAYVPNSQRTLARLPYRQAWDVEFRNYLRKLAGRKDVIVAGDFNVAHTPIDLANPKANVKNHGFTPEERAGFSELLTAGFVDTFREFEPGGGHYTWWSPMGGARKRNVGWRLDYFLVSASLRPRLKTAFIRSLVTGSDHCPVGIELS